MEIEYSVANGEEKGSFKLTTTPELEHRKTGASWIAAMQQVASVNFICDLDNLFSRNFCYLLTKIAANCRQMYFKIVNDTFSAACAIVVYNVKRHGSVSSSDPCISESVTRELPTEQRVE